MTPTVALIGTGRLASALAPALKQTGVKLVSVVARSNQSALGFRRRFPDLSKLTGTELQGDPGLILLAVPDREITRTARELAAVIGRETKVALHHAGGLGPEALAPLQDAGLATGVLHPLQVLGVAGQVLLRGSYARIDGNPRARQAAESLAAEIGMKPLSFRRRPDRSALAAYHAGAALASNDLVALISLGAEMLAAAGIGRRQALEAVTALAEGAIRNLREGGLEGAITGPVARGDQATVAAHLDRLKAVSPEAREIHRLLSRRILDLAGPEGDHEYRKMQRLLGRPRSR